MVKEKCCNLLFRRQLFLLKNSYGSGFILLFPISSTYFSLHIWSYFDQLHVIAGDVRYQSSCFPSGVLPRFVTSQLHLFFLSQKMLLIQGNYNNLQPREQAAIWTLMSQRPTKLHICKASHKYLETINLLTFIFFIWTRFITAFPRVTSTGMWS